MYTYMGFPGGSVGKESACNAGDIAFDPCVEKALHSRILAWRIPWTEEPCGLWSTVSQRAGHK